MLQESHSKTPPIRSSLNEAGDVGHHEATVLAHIQRDEIGVMGREGIVRHLGAGMGNRANESRFAGIGQSKEPNVRDHLKLKEERALLARQALSKLTG